MTPLLRLRENNVIQWPYPVDQFKRDEPHLSISDNPHPGELATYAALAPPILVYQVADTAPPEIDPRTQRLLPVKAEEINGTWQRVWPVRDATAAEIEEYDAANQPPPPAADWVGFQTELLQSATFSAARIQARQIIESELSTAEGVRQQRLLRAATALSDIGAVVLAAASQQNPSLFIGAWMILRQAHLVSPEVATGMMQIATAYNLPPNLIQSLGAP